MSIHTGRRSPLWLWALVPLHVLWISLHGGWMQSVGVLLAFLGARVGLTLRARWLGRTVESALPPVRLGLVLLASVGAAGVLNPYGMRLLWFPFEMEAAWIRAIGPEWQSITGQPGWKDVWKISVLFWTLGGLVLWDAARRWRREDWAPPAILLLWLALS